MAIPPLSEPPAPRVELWAPGAYDLAEGPRWVDGRLVFVDIPSGRLLEVRGTQPRTPRELLRLDVPLGAVAPVRDRPAHWIAAAGTGIALLGPAGAVEWLARPEDHARTPARMNDGACDPHGRFWAGSMAYDRTPGAGSLYRTDPDGSVHRVLDGLTIVNGPAFNQSGDLLYVTDSAARVVYRYRVDPAGDLHDGVEFARLTDGVPDGMTVDTEGCLWVALWDGASVRRYHPCGTPLSTLRLPAARPTAVCLHPSGSRLLITTARRGIDRPSDFDGALLCVPTTAAATGIPACGWSADGSSRTRTRPDRPTERSGNP